MKASETLLSALFKGPRQFLIPIFQRPYSWVEKHCAQFFDDVVRIAGASGNGEQHAHFVGSVVYVERGLYQATAVPELLVIDGQQRLTTFSLFVESLARALEETEEVGSDSVTPRKLRNYFLFNADEEGESRFKLVLSSDDDATLRALIQKKELPDKSSPRVVENFAYFTRRIAETELSIDQLYAGLSRLVVVGVSLDRNHDNPQLIFESLNSTGMELTQADLVRNFVLMSLEPRSQKELYEDHWLPMERLLGAGQADATFDAFLRAWLTMRTLEVPNRQQGYEKFKSYRQQNLEQPIHGLVADLHRFAHYYARIVLGREQSARLATVWQGLQALRVDAPVPFLMFAMKLEASGAIDEFELIAVAELIESWVLRRSICDVPSNVLSRTFASLPRQVDVEALADSLAAWLVHRKGRQVFPADEEFRRALTSRDLYHHRSCQQLLTRLENHDRKEPVARGQYTIEHVIPQNEPLPEEWREMLGPDWQGVQDRVLHTLGNLTLTGYNPELSDRPFETKRDMKGGFKDSPLRLNRSLAASWSWNELDVVKRAEELADKALEIWSRPRPSQEMRDRYDPFMHRRGVLEIEGGELAGLELEAPQTSLYTVLEDGLTELGYTPLTQKSQFSFQRPGRKYCPDIACWLKRGKLRIQLRGTLAVGDSTPEWFKTHTTAAGLPRIYVDASSADHIDAVIEHVRALTPAEAGTE